MLIKKIAMGDAIPTGHRVVYNDYTALYTYTALFGLHYILRTAVHIWSCTFYFRPSALELMLDEAYRQGMAAGHIAACHDRYVPYTENIEDT